MKFLHTADWHIGRKLNGYSLLEEQEDVYKQMLQIAKEQEVDAIIVAGDLYDRSVPSVDAVALLNKMMIDMNLTHGFPVLGISGNHDSGTRLETGAPWLKASGFHLHTRLEQAFEPVEMKNVQFFLLPYFEPFHAREYFGDDSIRDIQTAMPLVIEEMMTSFDSTKKQVLVGHFFATGSSKGESETPLEVGGLDNVPLNVLDVFDYVALGHLHSPNALTQSEKIKYSGSLLKYSLSEENQTKGVRLVTFTEEGMDQQFYPVTPLRDVKQLTASFETLVSKDYYESINRENYYGITLTDKVVIVDVLNQLREIYPNIISLERAHLKKVSHHSLVSDSESEGSLKPEELIKRYYEEVASVPLTEGQKDWLEQSIIEYKKER